MDINESISYTERAGRKLSLMLYNNDVAGHFLYVAGALDNPKAIELSSPWYQESGPYCKLSVALHMNNMEDGNLKIVVETRNHTWVIVETLGNGLRE